IAKASLNPWQSQGFSGYKKADASIRSICLPVFIVYHKGIEVEKLLFVSVIFTIYLSVLF
ncbi:MAG TPA: hypothetical protein PLS20_10190, partial [Ruminococcus flavefaciens]|nr:hypothetical protein [Ruminococcus flavefaciens]